MIKEGDHVSSLLMETDYVLSISKTNTNQLFIQIKFYNKN